MTKPADRPAPKPDGGKTYFKTVRSMTKDPKILAAVKKAEAEEKSPPKGRGNR